MLVSRGGTGSVFFLFFKGGGPDSPKTPTTNPEDRFSHNEAHILSYCTAEANQSSHISVIKGNQFSARHILLLFKAM